MPCRISSTRRRSPAMLCANSRSCRSASLGAISVMASAAADFDCGPIGVADVEICPMSTAPPGAANAWLGGGSGPAADFFLAMPKTDTAAGYSCGEALGRGTLVRLRWAFVDEHFLVRLAVER